jgi:hypothetical protein
MFSPTAPVAGPGACKWKAGGNQQEFIRTYERITLKSGTEYWRSHFAPAAGRMFASVAPVRIRAALGVGASDFHLAALSPSP